LLAKRRKWIASAQFVGAGLLANTVGQARRYHGLISSRASALLRSIQATSGICDVCKSVGAGLLANAVGQARRCHRLIFFAASALLQLIQATSETCDVCKYVGAGLLANTVGQPRRCHRLIFFPGKRAPAVDPGNLRNLRQTGFDDSSAPSKSQRLQLNRLAPRE
jgi:hypothetical protein